MIGLRILSPIESRIKIFEKIRDIPYAVIPEFIDPERGPVGILTKNNGSCSPKHFLLGIMYRKLEIPIKYVSYPFYWGELDADAPLNVRKLADEMPLGYHVACKAYINERWMLIDATWDPPLKRVGFPVNEVWDGVSDTINAVKSHEEIVHENEHERMEYLNTKTAWYREKEKTLSNEFYNKFNNWLEEVRKQVH